jgi:hypothetical protein
MISNIATTFTLLGASLVAVMWVRSYRFAEELRQEITTINLPTGAVAFGNNENFQRYSERGDSTQAHERRVTLVSNCGALYWFKDDLKAPIGTGPQYARWYKHHLFMIVVVPDPRPSFGSYKYDRLESSGPYPTTPWYQFGFMIRHASAPHIFGGISSYTSIRIPYWAIFALLLAIPVARMWRRLSAKSRPGHCPKCNYDLRASKDRCPECGHPIPNPNRGAAVPPAP